MILLCAFALLLVSLLHPLAIDNAKHELDTVNVKLDAFRTQHAGIMSGEAPLRLCFAGPTPDTNGYGNKLYRRRKFMPDVFLLIQCSLK